MVKKRIIPTLLYKNFTLVKGVQFNSWRRIGNLMQAIKVYNMREVDELIFLDISASLEDRPPDFSLIDDFADECFMPLAVGGGIKTADDVKRLLQCGADKIVLNSAAFLMPELIKEIAKTFGSQCIVISIDAKQISADEYETYIFSGTKATGKSPSVFAKQVEDLGAGEIILTSIDKDGMMQGYDLELIKKVAGAVSIPVIASGGAGNYVHMLEAIVKAKASAVAAASIFHFTESTPLEAKRFLANNGVNVRI